MKIKSIKIKQITAAFMLLAFAISPISLSSHQLFQVAKADGINASTNAATNITASDATLNGTNGTSDSTGNAFWVSTAPFSTASADVPADVYTIDSYPAAMANGTFSASLSSVSGLTVMPNTTYYVTAWTQVDGTWYPGQQMNFTTTGTSQNNTNSTTNAATNVTGTDATLNGTNGTNGAMGSAFWVSTSPFSTASADMPANVYTTSSSNSILANGTFSASLSSASGLPTITPNTTYYFTAWTNVDGTWYPGQQLSFTTSGTEQTNNTYVTAHAATNITASDATLNATLGTSDAAASSFWVSTSPFSTASSDMPANVYSTPTNGSTTSANAAFSGTLSSVVGLTVMPNTTYYFAPWVYVNNTWHPGEVMNFTTSSGTQTGNTTYVTANAATNITASDATLNGTNGTSDATGHSFWVSTSPIDTGSTVIPANVYTKDSFDSVSANGTFSNSLSSVSGLTISPNTTYYFVAWTQVDGTWHPSSQMSFTTLSNGGDLSGTLSSGDFSVTTANYIKGYTAKFNLSDATFSGASSVVVKLYSGDTLLQTDTLGGTNAHLVTGTQISAPFDVFGTFNYSGDGYWANVRGSEYGTGVAPTKAVATVTLANGKVVTAEDTNLSGDYMDIFPSGTYVTTNAATAITSTNATLNGTNGTNDATGHSFWVSTAPFSTASADMPANVYDIQLKPDSINANTAFSVSLSDVEGLPAITANTTYYVVAWSKVDGTWYPGDVMSFTTLAANGGTNGTIDGTVSGTPGVLGVTSIDPISSNAIADGTFEHGWKYVFNITVPTNESHLSMKFGNWMMNGGAGSIAAANNIRISSPQADNNGATVLTSAANTYGTPSLHMTGDLDPTKDGIQVKVTVETAVPLNSTSGSYSTSYGIKTE